MWTGTLRVCRRGTDRPPASTAKVDAGGAEEPIVTTGDGRDRFDEQEVPMDHVEDGSDVSVVSQGTRIEGTVTAAGSLRVDGEVRGKITAAKEVSLSPQGRVEANIQATTITLAGQVKGDLAAKGDVSLPADSRLNGNIRAHNVQVGGVVMGDIVAKGKVELGPRARVEGDITSQLLAIAEGAVFIGASSMGEGSSPERQDM
jgi:cytoskeletal protein CcmA (bactofilin family)